MQELVRTADVDFLDNEEVEILEEDDSGPSSMLMVVRKISSGDEEMKVTILMVALLGCFIYGICCYVGGPPMW